MLTSRCFVDSLSLFEQGFIQPLMSLLRRNELDPAMPVLSVVPADEAVHPLSRLAYIAETIHWSFRAVFQRTEQRLNMRVVIAHPRPAVRRRYLQIRHLHLQHLRLHWRTVIRIQLQWLHSRRK